MAPKTYQINIKQPAFPFGEEYWPDNTQPAVEEKFDPEVAISAMGLRNVIPTAHGYSSFFDRKTPFDLKPPASTEHIFTYFVAATNSNVLIALTRRGALISYDGLTWVETEYTNFTITGGTIPAHTPSPLVTFWDNNRDTESIDVVDGYAQVSGLVDSGQTVSHTPVTGPGSWPRKVVIIPYDVALGTYFKPIILDTSIQDFSSVATMTGHVANRQYLVWSNERGINNSYRADSDLLKWFYSGVHTTANITLGNNEPGFGGEWTIRNPSIVPGGLTPNTIATPLGNKFEMIVDRLGQVVGAIINKGGVGDSVFPPTITFQYQAATGNLVSTVIPTIRSPILLGEMLDNTSWDVSFTLAGYIYPTVTPIVKPWTYAVVADTVYCYRPGLGKLIKLSVNGQSWISVSPTSMVLTNMLGLSSAKSRLLMWDTDNSLSLSGITNVEDFTPSISTRSNVYKVDGIRGSITQILPYEDGYIIYTTASIVLATYIGGTLTFRHSVLSKSVGIINPRNVVEASTSEHFAFTSSGLQLLTARGLTTISPELDNYIAHSRKAVRLDWLEGRYLSVGLSIDRPSRVMRSAIDLADTEYAFEPVPGTQGYPPIPSFILPEQLPTGGRTGSRWEALLSSLGNTTWDMAVYNIAAQANISTSIFGTSSVVWQEVGTGFTANYTGRWSGGPSGVFTDIEDILTLYTAVTTAIQAGQVGDPWTGVGGGLKPSTYSILSDVTGLDVDTFEGITVVTTVSSGFLHWANSISAQTVIGMLAWYEYLNEVKAKLNRVKAMLDGINAQGQMTMANFKLNVDAALAITTHTKLQVWWQGSFTNGSIIVQSIAVNADSGGNITVDTNGLFPTPTTIAVVQTSGGTPYIPGGGGYNMFDLPRTTGITLPVPAIPPGKSTPNPPLTIPGGSFLGGMGINAQVDPIYDRFLLLDTKLKSWGSCDGGLRQLLSYSPVNAKAVNPVTGEVGSAVTYDNLSKSLVIHAVGGNMYLAQASIRDEEASTLTFGNLGLTESGITTFTEAIGYFVETSNAVIEVEGSIDGELIDVRYTVKDYLGAQAIAKAQKILTCKWFRITIKGHYNLKALDFTGFIGGNR